MRTIRLKGKQIILSIVFMAAALLIVYLSAGPHLLMYQARRLNNNGQIKEAQAVYDRVAELFPYSSVAPYALYQSAEYDTPSNYSFGSRFEEAGVVYIFPDFSSAHGAKVTTKDAQSAIEKYKKLAERYQGSSWAEHGLKQLAAAYHYLEDYENTEYYLKEYIAKSRYSAAEGYLMLAELYRKQERYSDALNAIEMMQQEEPGHNALDAALIKGEILTDMGRLDEAQAVVKRIPAMAEEQFSDLADHLGEDARLDNVDIWVTRADRLTALIEAARDNPDYGGKITGTIKKGNTPFEGVYVYAQSKTYSNVTQSPPDYIAKVRTGKNGEFSIEGLLPGHYQIGLGVPSHLLEGYTLEKKDEMSLLTVDSKGNTNIDLRFVERLKLISPTGGEQVDLSEITFTWEEVPGAKTYTLYVGPVTINDNGVIASHSFAPLATGITQNSVTLSLNDFDLKKPLTVSYDEKGVSPEVVLGLLYPGGSFTWGVYAYDEKGSEITASRGYGSSYSRRDLPLVSVEGNIANKGDRLLMGKKYAEAVSFYQETLKEDPNDIHSLSALAKLSHYGMNKTREDYLKAAGYYRRILEIADAPELQESLADVLFEAGDYKYALTEYEKLKSQLSSWLTYYKIGQCQFLSGNTNDAFESFDRAAGMKNGKYMRGYPVAAAIVTNRIDKALGYAALMDEGVLYIDALKEFAAKGYYVDEHTVSLIKLGDLNGALEILDQRKPFDLFIRGLVYRLAGEHSPAEDAAAKLQQMTDPESEFLSSLLRKILGR